MFRSFFRYLKGYLKIRIKGYSPERFVNLCKYKGIEIWDLKYNLDSYEMYISVSDFRKLKPLLKKTVTKVLILERLGFPFFLYHYRKRKLFFVGIAVCILFVYMMTLFLWRIEIEGNQRITNDVILEYLEEKQIHYGMKMKEIQCEQIVKDMRKEFDEIIWVSASLEGTCLTIHVKENTDTFSVSENEKTPQDIISDKKGTVISMVTRTGVPMVHPGDVVEVGDVLVSGTIDVLNDAKEVVSQNRVCADADIVIETQVSYADYQSVNYQKKCYTERKRRVFELYLKDAVIRIGIERHPFKSYELRTTKELFWGFKKVLEYELEKAEYNKGEVENLLKKRFSIHCETLALTSTIIKKELQITHDNKGATAEGILILQESAGTARKIVDF